jgi:hypothetical protein
MNTLYRYIYTSTMADAAPAHIPRILRAAKLNNSLSGVTSLLIFDGLHFCQYLEGAKATLDALLQRIIQDERHAEVRILGQGKLEDGRRFAQWPVAFALTDEPEALNVFHSLGDESPFELLERLLPTLDLGDITGI